jgi:hypothetical protein
MTLKFAGQSLLLEDPEGRAASWMKRHLDISQISLFGNEQTAYAGNRSNARSSSLYSCSLPKFNYTERPPLAINSLYWPTGATRWSCGLFLASDTELSAIYSNLQQGASSTSGTAGSGAGTNYSTVRSGLLEFGDPTTGGVIQTQMYLLPPRPISCSTLPGNRLWLLPMVDVRYYWQFRRVGLYAPSTWAEALSLLAAALGVSLSGYGGSVDTVWGKPDSVELKRDHENAAMLLDAVVASIGLRVVRRYDGTINAVTPAGSEAQVAANVTASTKHISGGPFGGLYGAVMPEKVTTIFSSSSGNAASNPTTVNLIDRATPPGVTFLPSAEKTIFSTSKFTSPPTKATNLANAIADNYFAWQKLVGYDRSFAGCVPWQSAGSDDFIQWDFGRKIGRKYLAQTRVQSMPMNFGVETMLNQLDDSSSSSSSESSQSSQSESSASGSGSGSIVIPPFSSSESGSESGSTSASTSGSGSGSGGSGSSSCCTKTVVTNVECSTYGGLVVTKEKIKYRCDGCDQTVTVDI